MWKRAKRAREAGHDKGTLILRASLPNVTKGTMEARAFKKDMFMSRGNAHGTHTAHRTWEQRGAQTVLKHRAVLKATGDAPEVTGHTKGGGGRRTKHTHNGLEGKGGGRRGKRVTKHPALGGGVPPTGKVEKPLSITNVGPVVALNRHILKVEAIGSGVRQNRGRASATAERRTLSLTIKFVV